MSSPTDVPLGFWLRTVDGLFDSSMDDLFAADGVTRRLWQLLSTVQRNQPVAGSVVEDAMAPSLDGKAESAGDLLSDLQRRGWVEPDDGLWQLTEQGRSVHAGLQKKVAEHRDRMFRGVDDEAYRTTVETLAQITRNLDPEGKSSRPFR